jgi:hypothetical protein
LGLSRCAARASRYDAGRRLLLIIAFDRHAVAGFDNCLEQPRGEIGSADFSVRDSERGSPRETGAAARDMTEGRPSWRPLSFRHVPMKLKRRGAPYHTANERPSRSCVFGA